MTTVLLPFHQGNAGFSNMGYHYQLAVFPRVHPVNPNKIARKVSSGPSMY